MPVVLFFIFKLCELFSEGVIFKAVVLVFKIFVDISFRYIMFFLLLLSFVEGGKFFPVTTRTGEDLTFAFPAQF